MRTLHPGGKPGDSIAPRFEQRTREPQRFSAIVPLLFAAIIVEAAGLLYPAPVSAAPVEMATQALIAGDNDHLREREIGADGRPKQNVGRIKAEAAAGAIGGDVLIPPFEPQQPGSDWNDLAQLLGDRLRPVLDAALAAAERRLSAARARHGGEDAQPRPKRSSQSTR